MAPARIRLEPLCDDDSDKLFGWINDRELVLLSAPFRPVDRSDHDRWFEAVRTSPEVAIFAIRRADDGRLIGSCQLNEIDRAAATCQLQIRIGERSCWGQGYGTEAVTELLRYAFGVLAMRRVRLHVFADNTRAIRAYEKAGFRLGRALPPVAIDGALRELVEMTALAEQDDA